MKGYASHSNQHGHPIPLTTSCHHYLVWESLLNSRNPYPLSLSIPFHYFFVSACRPAVSTHPIPNGEQGQKLTRTRQRTHTRSSPGSRSKARKNVPSVSDQQRHFVDKMLKMDSNCLSSLTICKECSYPSSVLPGETLQHRYFQHFNLPRNQINSTQFRHLSSASPSFPLTRKQRTKEQN